MLGTEPLAVAESLRVLARFNELQGKSSEAEQFYQRALAIYKNEPDPEHQQIGYILLSLAEIYHSQGRYEQVKQLYREALTIAENAQDPQLHQYRTNILLRLAQLSHIQDQDE